MAWHDTAGLLVIAGARSGGTMLCHALDSHPSLSCSRDEPLGKNGYWRMRGQPVEAIIDFYFSRPGYAASGFKVTHAQSKIVPTGALIKRRASIIYLERKNIVRQAVSMVARNRQARPAHMLTYGEPPVADNSKIETRPGEIVTLCRRIEEYSSAARALVESAAGGGCSTLRLVYEDIIPIAGGWLPDKTGRKISGLLGVCNFDYFTETVAISPEPLRDMLSNFDAVASELVGTKWEAMLYE